MKAKFLHLLAVFSFLVVFLTTMFYLRSSYKNSVIHQMRQQMTQTSFQISAYLNDLPNMESAPQTDDPSFYIRSTLVRLWNSLHIPENSSIHLISKRKDFPTQILLSRPVKSPDTEWLAEYLTKFRTPNTASISFRMIQDRFIAAEKTLPHDSMSLVTLVNLDQAYMASGYLDKLHLSFGLLGLLVFCLYYFFFLRRIRTLEKQYDRIEQVLEDAEIGSWTVDTITFQLEWDSRLHRLFGSNPDTFTGSMEEFELMLHPDDRAYVKNTVEQLFREGGTVSMEYRIISSSFGFKHIGARGYSDVRNGRLQKLHGICFDVTKYKETERKLIETGNNYKSLLQALHHGVFVADMNGYLEYYNEAFTKLVQCGSTNLEGVNFVDFVVTEQQERAMEMLSEVAKQHAAPKTHIFKFRLLSHGELQCEVSVNFRGDEFGHPTGLIAIVTDITNRMKSQKELVHSKAELEQRVEERTRELQESYALQRIILDNSDIGVIYVKDRTIIWANRRLAALIQRKPDELAGQSTRILYPSEEDYHRAGEVLYSRLSVSRRIDITIKLARLDGTVFDARMIGSSLAPSFPHHGSVWLIEDITKRLNAQRDMQEKQALQELLLTSLPIAFYILVASKERREYTYFSDTIKNLSGWKSDSLVGTDNSTSWQSIVHPDDRDRFISTLNYAHRSREISLEYRVQHADGSYRWFRDRAIAIQNPDEDTISFVGTLIDATDQIHSEISLRDSEHRHRKILESTSEGFWMINSDFRTVEVNQALCCMLGYLREEMIGKTPFDFVDERNAKIFQEQFSKIVTTEARSYEITLTRKDRRPLHCLFSATTLSRGGKSFSAFAFVTDITGRKEAEQTLRRTNALLASLIESPKDLAILSLDKNFCYTVFNRNHYADMQMMMKQEIRIGDSLLDKLTPEGIRNEMTTAEFGGILKKAFQGKLTDAVVRIKFNESYAFLEAHFHTIQDTDGTTTGMTVFIRDITQKKLEELSLQRVRTSLEQVSDGIFWLDHDYCLVDLNDTFCSMTGYNKNELLDLDIHNFQIFDNDRHFQELWQRLSMTRIEVFEADLTNKSGLTFPVSVRAHMFIFEGQELICALIRDISEERMATKRLHESISSAKAASQAKTEFLANMSHELRTPLNAILGYAQLLRDNQKDRQQLERGLSVIYNSGEHLLTLINDILDLSKIEASQMSVEPKVIELPDFLKQIADMTEIKARAKGLRLNRDFDPSMPHTVSADEKRMRQILLNLLGNAVKFTEEGEITLSVRAKEPASPRFVFKVIDTGVGIPEDQQPDIFESFKQASSPMKNIEGTGLGLAISKRLAELMGGCVYLEDSTDSGSVFIFEVDLPATSDEEKTFSLVEQKPEGYEGERKRILLVDDNPDNLSLFEDMLVSLGFVIHTSNDGSKVLDTARSFRPDAVLMDLFMPGVNGFEATKMLRSEEEFSSIPIIAVSASLTEQHRHNALLAGCDEFVSKPLSFSSLTKVLEKSMGITWTVNEHQQMDEERAFGYTKPFVLPCRETLCEMLRLASLGDISELVRLCEQSIKVKPECEGFIKHVRQLAGSFDLEEIETLLKEQLDKESES